MKKTILGCLISIFAAFGIVTSSFALSMGFAPVSQTVLPGGSLDVDVIVSGLHTVTPNEVVSTFDLFVTYDNNILTATAVAFGPYLGNPFLSLTGVDLPSPGAVNIFELSLLPDNILDSMQPDAFTLATLSFDTVKAGTSSLGFAPHPIFGVQDVKGLGGQVLSLNISSGNVDVVPEPGTMLLMASGLGGVATWSGIAGRRRKRKNKQ